ncbi:DNA polymerase IV [Vibrio inusitatus NBRC 102082]|uniref:DNA polymerase IV n=1 Tax=Vibrio inusitatus NBRC 102082 TaxID=1219070 RepID=A0A4Y3HVG9_9VIBR|nr:DNA polymerase IV [Vibrio inusitatus]GEA51169.1 DNA polymerase IV [Vibrio inusitatus NBRC 102082]
MRDFPEYRNRPLAVGGSETQRGVLSTCNYEARRFGIHSAMPTAQAKKLCPHLLVVPGRMSMYKEVSAQIRAIFARYTHIIEPLSLDEAYLDVTDSPSCNGSATLIAQSIRRDIESELNLTASAGVAPIKFLAKVASDLNKPNGQYVIPPSQVQEFIDSMPLQKIPGVGKVALQRLHRTGLYLGEDVRNANYRDLLVRHGRLGASLWKRCHGIDNRSVQVSRERKSVGVERTFTKNIEALEQCWEVIEQRLYPELQRRLDKVGGEHVRPITKQGIKVKFADFQLTTIETGSNKLNLAAFYPLLEEVLLRQQGREIRLLGLSVMLQPEAQAKQLSLLDNE